VVLKNKMNIGERQKQWFDFLQSCSRQSLEAAISKKGYHSKWMHYTNFNEVVNLRLPIEQEIIVDFDGRKRKLNYKRAKEVMEILSRTTYPHYLTDHCGRGPHIHIFNVTPAIGYAILKKLNTTCAEILYGRHMVRCEGSLYKNNKTYKSVFESVDEIKPIEKLEDVLFPEINIQKQDEINNFKKYNQLAEKYLPVLPVNPDKKTDWSLDNLPPKYRHLQNGVTEGTRDISLCTLTGVFKKCGLNRSEALTELRLFNQRCSPSLPDKILKEKIRRLW